MSLPMPTSGGVFLHATVFEMAAAQAFNIAQNQPFLDADRMGGASEAVLAAVKAGDPAALALALPNDPSTARDLAGRLAQEGSAALREVLLREKRTDTAALFLEEAHWAAAEKAEEHRLAASVVRLGQGGDAPLAEDGGGGEGHEVD